MLELSSITGRNRTYNYYNASIDRLPGYDGLSLSVDHPKEARLE